MRKCMVLPKYNCDDCGDCTKDYDDCRVRYINDLFELGKIQGEHNARWQDESCRKLSCELYYEKTKHILEDNNIVYNKSCEDFREYDDEEEYYLLDKLTFDMVDEVREYLIRKILEEE